MIKPELLDNDIYEILCNAIKNDRYYSKYDESKITEKHLLEMLTEANLIYEKICSTDRYETGVIRVVKIDEYYIRYNWSIMHNDDWFEFEWESVELVKPVEVKTIEYVKI